EDIRHGGAAFLTEVPPFDQRVGLLRDFVYGERAAIDEHDDHRLAEREQRIGQLLLLRDELQAVAIAEVIVRPALAAERTAGADGEHDLIRLARDLDRLADEG